MIIVYLYFITYSGYGVDDRGSTPDRRDFSVRHEVQISTGVHLYRGTGGFFSGNKVSEETPDHSLPSNAGLKLHKAMHFI